MRNNRLSPMTLAAGALAVAMIAGSAGGASAADYDGDRSWNGSNRVEHGNGHRGNANNHRRDDDDRGRNHNGGWNGGRDRGYGDGYGNHHHHWRGGYKPWWRYSRDYSDRYYGPRRPWWNRYY